MGASDDQGRAPFRLVAAGSRLVRTLTSAAAVPLLDRVSHRTETIIRNTARIAGLPGRAVWSHPGRHHIEVRDVAQVGNEGFARRIEKALEDLPGVAWARVNAPSGRVVVSVQPPEPRLSRLIATIAAVERTRHLELDPDAPHPHPPEEGPRTKRSLSTLAADALGLGLSAASRILAFTPLPGEIATVPTIIDLHPRLHALLGKALHGQERIDSLLPVFAALAQGMTGNWLGITLDVVNRIWQWSEARAQLAAWTAAEERLTGRPEHAGAAATPNERPRAKPDGPVERYSTWVMNSGAVAAAAALPVFGPKRATALGLSTLPRATAAAREAYGAHLGRVLARRGVIAMDRSVLRQLDHIDTLLLDQAVLRSERGALTDLVLLPETDGEQVAAHAFALFDPDRPTAVRHGDGWSIGPLADLELTGPDGAAEADRLSGGDGTVLGLTAGHRLQAVIRTEAEPARGFAALLAAARRSGLRLLLAGADQKPDFAEATVPGGQQLVASVRTLQADGATVMLISNHSRALGAADCGLGIHAPDSPPPWGAHLIMGASLDEAALVVDAVSTARVVARQSVALAGAGTGLGTVLSFTSAPAQLPARTLAAVNAAAGIAFVDGLWRAHELSRRPVPPPASAAPWHLMPADTVLARLSSSTAGLSTEQVRQRHGGTSADNDDGPVSLARAFAEDLANPLTPVLAAGAGLSATVGSPVDAGLVGGVVALSALVGAVQRVRTERSLTALLTQSAVSARVRRDGGERTVPADDLVPGDIVVLTAGDVIPADCRVLESTGLEVDESSLTGESLPVPKTDRPVVAAEVAERASMVYEGTTVAAGSGVAVVVATGTETEAGRGVALARQAPPTTGVEARLARLTRTTIPLAAGSAVALLGAGLARRVPLAQTVASAANLAVAAVPEGLPFLVSAAQLAAARRLAEHGALVRNPRTIEALGRVDVLCFDKTGTLTEGRLRLVGVSDGERHAPVEALDERLASILVTGLRATPPADKPEELARQTDQAVHAGAGRANPGADPGSAGWRLTADLPFEPSRGYHATLGRCADGVLLLGVKGAPEAILPRCTRRRSGSGDQALDRDGHDELHRQLERHAGAGHRVLAVAERRLPDGGRDRGTEPLTDEDVTDLTFLGFLTIADVVRDSATPAVHRIRRAGVHTIMITGDHPATAEAIAATIADDGDQRVVTGTELEELSDDELAARLTQVDVVARCTPAHKVRIIQVLQKHGRTVAMTGDGANDAPAIRLADVGIALGRRGTPAARAAADLVVSDDRLETIIAALVEGRVMWTSVRQALSILVGGNIGEIAFSVVTAALTGRSALNSRQMLLVNLLTDLAPAMAIAVRPPSGDADDLLANGPDTALGQALSSEIALRAAATTLGASMAWTLARFTGRRTRANTIALAALVGTQLNQTALTGGTNPTTLAASVVSAALLAAVIQTPGLSQFFGCTPLGPVGWTIAGGSALGATLTNVVLKRLPGGLPGLLSESPDGQRPAGPDGTAGS